MKTYARVLRAVRVLFFVLLLQLLVFLPTASGVEKLLFADLNWNSAQVHNRIAGFILINGYGYEVDYIPHQSVSGLKAVIDGTVDINMEVWVELQHEIYSKALVAGKILDLGPNFKNAWQGWIVPSYVVKGDPNRGIQAVAPDLVDVDDLQRYWKVFQDQQMPTKGRFHNCVSGTECAMVSERKILSYGLDVYFNIYSHPELGSDFELIESLEQGRPWLGYYWTPSWIMGKYDMIPIQEPVF